MISFIIYWLIFLFLIGAIFERGWNRALLIIYAILFLEFKFLPVNIIGYIIVGLTVLLIIILKYIYSK